MLIEQHIRDDSKHYISEPQQEIISAFEVQFANGTILGHNDKVKSLSNKLYDFISIKI